MGGAGGGERARVLARAEEARVELVHLQFTDVAGAIKSLTIPANRLARTLADGAWFDGSSVEGLARVAESDLFLQPDPATFAVLPWESTPTARLICDLRLPGGAPFPADPRQALRSVVAEAAERGFDYRVACEVEFFLFEERGDRPRPGWPPAPVDRGGYFDAVPAGRASELCWSAAEALARFGVEVEATHHEVAPGQHELDLSELGALEAADALVALKWALRALGRRRGLVASFMPKPLEAASGSGLHVAQLLLDRRAGGNAFFAPQGPYQLSPVGERFMAGQLAHARGMCAIVAPLVNSYKRLTGGAEAPARVCWARTHRGALLRVPEAAPSRAIRLELRAPDPSCNPYLALAVMLKAGLDGIASELPLPDPVEQPDRPAPDGEGQDGAPGGPLPATLGEALEELDWDPVVREALGQPIYERFLAAKEGEWLAFQHHISAWELGRYLEGA